MTKVAALGGGFDELELDTRPLFGRRIDDAHGDVPLHAHRKSQLVFSNNNVVTVTTDAGFWVTPPWRAVWVPSMTVHTVSVRGADAICSIYVEPAFAKAMPNFCCVLMISALSRELILALSEQDRWDEISSSQTERLATALLGELEKAPRDSTLISLPQERRSRRVAQAMIDDPSHRKTLAEWGTLVGASSRTLTRLFQRETGLSVAGWRQQLDLLLAIQMLGGGSTVQQISIELGYEMPSAFIAMFKRAMGCTPMKYINIIGVSNRSSRTE